jgi:hypothetical protein
MVKHLHPRFLESDSEYQAAESFWRDLFDRVAAENRQQGRWHSWHQRKFADGTPIPRDGNPIFEARSETLQRAVRIIQSPPRTDLVEIAAWVDTFDFADAGGPGFTEELVINLSLSEESSRLARRLIEQWMDRSLSRERVEDLVKQLKDFD